MDLKWLVYVTCVVITFGDFVASSIFQDCLKRDSISCLQMQLFRATQGFVDNPSIELFSGIELVKIGAKEGKSLEQKQVEESVENAADVESRQKALETYLIATGERIWKERTVNLNPAQTAKTLVNVIPETVTSQLTTFVSEARGNKVQKKVKKVQKEMPFLIPLLIAIKLKLVTLSAVAFMVITAIAKKAILAAVISLVLSGFTGVKGLTGSKPQVQATEIMGYQSASEWDPYTHGGGRFAHYGRRDLRTSRSEAAPVQQVLVGHNAS